ncbi:WD40 repeat-like protein [Amylostereum chailletii]|nr:WD40 repeat-like protein [Amylostereum chailletii]
MTSRKAKTAFKNARTIGPLYTGGPVAVTPDGRWIITCVGEEAVLTDLEESQEICRFVGDTESITSMCVAPSGRTLCVFTSAMALRVYDLPHTSTPLPKPVHPVRTVARAHDAPVHVSRVDPTSTYLASGSADGTVKVWDLARGYATHALRGHGGVVSALAFSYPPAAGLEARVMRLVTASVDTRVRVWDLARGAVMAKKGKAVKPEAVLEGHVSVPRGLDVSADGKWLVSGGRDSVVLVWDMEGRKAKGKGKERAKEEGITPVLVNTVTVLERVEAVGLLDEEEEIAGEGAGAGRIRFFTAGEKGAVKVWDGREGAVLCTLGQESLSPSSSEEDQEEQRQILDAFYVPSTSTIISIHADQNILFHSLATKTLSRQLIGFNDEVIDAAFLTPNPASPDSHLALATNSSLIRLYSTRSLDARLLSGHTDIVLSLAPSASGQVFASGAKDRAARIWAPSDAWGWACVAICEGHAESVGALAFARQDPDRLKFLLTGSQDRTIKMWDLSSVPLASSAGGAGADPMKLRSLATLKAHDKDINALDVAPTDALLASASQDKTAKVFAVSYAGGGGRDGARGELKLLGTCRGHKRGVWSVRFARTERVLASGSGDRTVRIWGLDDFACLRVLEGHANSVLRVEWLGEGTKEKEKEKEGGGRGGSVISAGADGLVKVWEARGEECLATLDGHEDKVWALAVSRDARTIVSGAADSAVIFWEDCTEEQDAHREAARADLVLKEQDFVNYVALRDYRRAIELALALGHPGRLFKLFRGLFASSVDGGAGTDGSITGNGAVDEVLRTLHPADLARLLRYVRDWNTRAATAGVAQRVLHAVVKLRPADEIVRALEPSAAVLGEEGKEIEVEGEGEGEEREKKKGAKGKTECGVRELVEALIPYTERHLARMERLVQESYVVDYVLGEMDGLGGLEGDERMEVDFEEV